MAFARITQPGLEKSHYNCGMTIKKKIWISRVLVGIVTFFNLDAAFSFLIDPEYFSPAFELSGVPGHAMIQGMGLLFLMWNIPYIFAILNPVKHFTSLIEANVMQAIGVIGETILLVNLAGTHPIVRSSALRFIFFDASGLILLLLSYFILVRDINRNKLLPEKLVK